MIFMLICLWILFSFVYQKLCSNPYINSHSEHLKNDKYYEDYLKWCEKKTQIPMDKKVFIQEIEDKEKFVEDMFRKL